MRELIACKEVGRVLALTRRSLPYSDGKVTELLGEFPDVVGALSEPASAYFCCLGTTMKQAGTREAFERVDHDYVLALANAVPEPRGSQFLIVSALGASVSSPSYYFRVKGRVETALSTYDFRSLHIFRPGLIDTDREVPRLGDDIGRVLMKGLNPLLVGRLSKYRSIPASVIARSMLFAALQGTEGRRVYDGFAMRSLVSDS